MDSVGGDHLNPIILGQRLKRAGATGFTAHTLRHLCLLVPRQDMTGADRQRATRYNAEDILRYSRGSAALEIEGGSYARVVSTNPKENLVTGASCKNQSTA